MARNRTVHRCSACGSSSPTWAGRCPGCGEWGTLVEELDVAEPAAGHALPLGGPGTVRPISEVEVGEFTARPTGIDELDRVLGGGLVPGSVTLLAGEPGIGKSTLLTQLSATVAAGGRRVLYVAGEESRQQVRLRAERLGGLVDGVWLASEVALPHVLAHVDEVDPAVLLVDSVQTLVDPALASAPGSVAQVRACAHRLVTEAKARNVAVVLVGHVTKDGGLAGPRVLEHVVDTVLAFEGDRHHALRLLRATKHRFGGTGELGLFEMGDDGLRGVPDASGLFLTDRQPGLPGSVVVPTLEGHRPLLAEVQALVAASTLAQPRRTSQGIDGGRLSLLLAVLDKVLEVGVAHQDVFALAVGGARVTEPAADLGIALAVVSSAKGLPVDPDLVAIGEVGLGGELRQVVGIGRRLAEAARLGFTTALVPANSPDPPPGIAVVRAHTLAGAVSAPGVLRDPPGPVVDVGEARRRRGDDPAEPARRGPSALPVATARAEGLR